MRGADLHSTAGCHPTSTSEIDSYPGGSERYLADLRTLIMEDRGEGGSKRVISVGEIGLGGCGAAPSRRQIELPPIPSGSCCMPCLFFFGCRGSSKIAASSAFCVLGAAYSRRL
jgi:hypothetical protein